MFNQFFFAHNGKDFLIMAITVDYFCVVARSKHMYNELVHILGTKYKAKDLGLSTRIIGCTIHRHKHNNSIHISQPNLAKALLIFQECGTQYHRRLLIRMVSNCMQRLMRNSY